MKSRKSFNLLVLSFTLMALVSCTAVIFENPVPQQAREMESFPAEYRGTYTSVQEDITDVLVINENNYSLGEISGVLGQNAVLKPYQKYWVLNQKMEEGPGHLVFLGVFDLKKSEAELFYMNLSDDNERLQQLKNITAVKEERAETGELTAVYISPTDEEFKKMLESELFLSYGVFKKQ